MQRTCAHPPQGALPARPDGSVVWRVWAPLSAAVSLVTFAPDGRREIAMTPEGDGYFVHRRAAGGRRAAVCCSGWPTAASIPTRRRAGSPRASIALRPSSFPSRTRWSDAAVARRRPRGPGDLRIARRHVHAGGHVGRRSFRACRNCSSLGVTAVELMPVAQFPGDRNWGYDGVYPYAVQNSYGGPRALQRLVDAAHRPAWP